MPEDLSPAAELLLLVFISAALFVPCFWQKHIHAGDLALALLAHALPLAWALCVLAADPVVQLWMLHCLADLAGLRPLARVLDPARIGRCFSFDNYQAATSQFRVRAFTPNRAVAFNFDVLSEIAEGRHIVTPQEAPLYAIRPGSTPEQRSYLRAFRAWERICISVSLSLPRLSATR